MPIHIQGGGSSKKTGIKSFIGGTRNNESSYDSRAWGFGTYSHKNLNTYDLTGSDSDGSLIF